MQPNNHLFQYLNQLKHLVKDYKVKDADHFLEKYTPVLISQDLIILQNNDPNEEYKYLAFAKLKEGEEQPRQFWKHKRLHKDDNIPTTKTKWLAGLEKKNHKGGFLSGFNTAALTV